MVFFSALCQRMKLVRFQFWDSLITKIIFQECLPNLSFKLRCQGEIGHFEQTCVLKGRLLRTDEKDDKDFQENFVSHCGVEFLFTFIIYGNLWGGYFRDCFPRNFESRKPFPRGKELLRCTSIRDCKVNLDL